jgi:hypothetical protein
MATTKPAGLNAQSRMIAAWRDDLARFVDQAILAPYNQAKGTAYRMTPQQAHAARELSALVRDKEAGQRREILGISIMSGTGTGKDSLLAWAILWFLTCFSYPKIPCVSVSADQLSKVLWGEIAKWLMYSPLRAQFTHQNDKLFLHSVPEEARGKRWMAFPKAANPKDSADAQIEGLAGIHEDHLLQVVDEGSGVQPPVFEALEGNMTGAVNVMLLAFNPRRSTGYAVETQYDNAVRWIPLRWNAEDSPLVERATIEARERKYGRESNTYRVSVLGLPPLVDDETLIPWDWIEEAVERDVEIPAGTPLIKAVDCGAGGDSSIIATRRGPRVYPLKRLKTADSQMLENWIGTDIDADGPDVVRIDTVGIGWAVEGAVREKKGAIVEAADARREASEPQRFFNKRAEMYWRLREAFERGAISIPDDGDLKDGLGATRCEYVLLKGQSVVKIIDKKRIKQELGHSPDEADAVAMTFFHPDRLASKVTRRRGPDPSPTGAQLAWMGA